MEGAGASAPSEEPKTETTLTTRIRINIPGSRPIPPVVVRKPVGDTQSGGGAAGERPAPAPEPKAAAEPVRPEPAPRPEPVAQAEPAPQADEKTSDWFAPRKASAPKPAAGAPALGPGPTAPAPAAPAAPAAPGSGFAGSATDGVPSVGSTTQSMPIVTPLTGGAPAGGAPAYDGTPAGGTPMYGHTPAGGTPRYDGTPAGGTPRYDGAGHTPAGGTPVYDGTPAGGTPAFHAQGAPANPLYDRGPGHTPAGGTPVAGGTMAPTGPTTGPVTGGSPVVGPGHPGGAARRGGLPNRGQQPPRMSDDTAILTPQPPAPVPGPGGDQGHVSGSTLTSGIPVVPAGGPDLTPRIPERTEPPAPPRPAAAARPAKKQRSKLVLAGVGVFGLVGLAYGAGLLMNHADVPKGTTVLGVDIGGGTKEEAVAKLEASLGKRAHAPLQLNVGGKKAELAPDKAGLALDAQETVRGAAGSDYNPVSVIGSLFGGERVVQPVFPIDEEKLGVALTDLAGSSGSAAEGTIVFSPGKATAVEGKPGKGLDVQRSMIAVKDAYRAQVETGRPNTVDLPVVTRQPTITKAELDRAMEEFAVPAMSGKIKIKAGAKSIDFGPAKSLPKILSMKAVDGRLVEVYNKQAIDELLDGVFDGIMITKADGTKHQVSADDVAFVMRDALRGKTASERTKTIDLSGEG
ncbi:hypothetical protein [Streptomyces sp. NPDC056632]|uniref:hypothetical protein n=1 Tax=Streptomyces sp. NPDC056632 TaxID=3345884 RepID=UPI0036CA3ACE